MASDWNVLMDKLAAANVTGREARVVAAIARKTLGYRKPGGDTIAASQIAKLTGISRTHVTEILVRLESRGIITRHGGCKGRAATISLNLNTPWEPVPSTGQVNLSHPRDTSEPKPVPQKGSKPVPSTGHTRVKGVNQKRPAGTKTFQNQVVEAYVSTGGNLDLNPSWRGSLLSQATELAKKHPEDLILAAVKRLGRDRDFPGYLKQRVQDLADKGGPCEWDGCDRSRLTPEQLTGCGCPRCEEWLPYAVGAA